MTKLQLRRGNSYRISGQVLEADGTPIDLTGATTTYVICQRYGQPLADALVSGPLTVTMADAGQFHFDLTAVTTAGWPVGAVYLAIIIEHQDGRRQQLPEPGDTRAIQVHEALISP
jgi:hypothetical protein